MVESKDDEENREENGGECEEERVMRSHDGFCFCAAGIN